MEEFLHQLIGIFPFPFFTSFYTSQVVQDFFHQQYYRIIDDNGNCLHQATGKTHFVKYVLSQRSLHQGFSAE